MAAQSERVLRILSEEGNKICADCSVYQPTWTILNFAVIIW